MQPARQRREPARTGADEYGHTSCIHEYQHGHATTGNVDGNCAADGDGVTDADAFNTGDRHGHCDGRSHGRALWQ